MLSVLCELRFRQYSVQLSDIMVRQSEFICQNLKYSITGVIPISNLCCRPSLSVIIYENMNVDRDSRQQYGLGRQPLTISFTSLIRIYLTRPNSHSEHSIGLFDGISTPVSLI